MSTVEHPTERDLDHLHGPSRHPSPKDTPDWLTRARLDERANCE